MSFDIFLLRLFGWKMGFEWQSHRAATIEKGAQTSGRAINHNFSGSTHTKIATSSVLQS